MVVSRLVTSPEVQATLHGKQPVVAFETTILSFGLPAPLNYEVALDCEMAARNEGCVPATMAILDGMIRAGLEKAQLEFFCNQPEEIVKVNLQNFAQVLASGGAGALTVAASMQACTLAGIRVFATGGIGGVHRGYASVPDISSDLVALSRFPVAVVCAGAKSILDIGATLEALETLGVPVFGFRCDTFPTFYCGQSRFHLEHSYETMEELARDVEVHLELTGRGALIVTPIPENASIPAGQVEEWIEAALAEAKAANVSGKAVTPFLLEKLETASSGRTLRANHELILNNAKVASALAKSLAR